MTKITKLVSQLFRVKETQCTSMEKSDCKQTEQHDHHQIMQWLPNALPQVKKSYLEIPKPSKSRGQGQMSRTFSDYSVGNLLGSPEFTPRRYCNSMPVMNKKISGSRVSLFGSVNSLHASLNWQISNTTTQPWTPSTSQMNLAVACDSGSQRRGSLYEQVKKNMSKENSVPHGASTCDGCKKSSSSWEESALLDNKQLERSRISSDNYSPTCSSETKVRTYLEQV